MSASYNIVCGDAQEVLKGMDTGSVHCMVCSPSYWGLRDYGIKGQLGLESTPEEYVSNLVAVFGELWRVLRDDGTIWVNLGDSYAGSWGNYGAREGNQRSRIAKHWHRPGYEDRGQGYDGRPPTALITKKSFRRDRAEMPKMYLSGDGLKPKDLVGIPWMVAFALRSAGWYLRQAIIWHKKNPMPGSQSDRPTTDYEFVFLLSKAPQYFYDEDAVRKEYTEPLNRWGGDKKKTTDFLLPDSPHAYAHHEMQMPPDSSGRTLRSVWTIPTQPANWDYCNGCDTLYTGANRSLIAKTYFLDVLKGGEWKRYKLPPLSDRHIEMIRDCADANDWLKLEIVRKCPKCKRTDAWVDHFSAYPEALVEPCIKAGTSEKGCCPKCGAPWVRRVERIKHGEKTKQHSNYASLKDTGNHGAMGFDGAGKRYDTDYTLEVQTVGWQPSCDCDAGDPVPCTVLDMFCGSGTTGLVATRLGRNFIGIDLKEEYCKVAQSRLKQATSQLRLV